MRVVLLIGALAGVLGLGLLGPLETGAAPVALRISAPRAAPSIAEPTLPPSDDRMVDLEAPVVAEGLDRPTAAVATPDGRLLVTEKSGVIRVVKDGEVLPAPFLDLSGSTVARGAERGLLGIALHPGYEGNGRLFVHLTDIDGDSRLIEYRVSSEDPDVADPRSGRLVMRVDQPGQFHNGGQILFGPDGYLYVGFGDGGFGRPARNGALRTNVLGSILRLDVDSAAPYAVPADNPYVGTRNAAEIWVSGLRNPWRFFIDATTRTLVVADVGQFDWEEITVLPLDAAGLDLGWPRLEGEECFEAEECSTAGLTPPDLVYSHSAGCAVIGGPVYRGQLVPELEGMVLYADFCRGWVRAFSIFDGQVMRTVGVIEPAAYGPILSLAVDGDGELLILTDAGEIRRLRRAG